MSNVNFLKPNKENLNLFLVLGSLFFTLGIVDFCLNNFYEKSPFSIIKTYVENTELNSYLENSGFTEKSQEIILVRNTIARNKSQNINMINQSIESIFEKINPQGNAYPSPFPLKSK